MSGDCVFCKIIRKELDCMEILATEDVLAFLDIAPVNKGHALVVPKRHHPTLWDLPQAMGETLLSSLQMVGRAVVEATGADGLNVMMNNHPAAGQEVFHAHFHIIPRHMGDGHKLWPQSHYTNQEEMAHLAASIRSAL